MTIRDRLAGGSLGFGAAPLGNMFRELTDDEAAATVDAAWQHGTRFFDTAPQYGAGLSEIRLGRQLAKHDRDDYELSTKVGRLILDELETGPRQFGEKGDLFSAGRANRMVYDYSEKGTLKSIEDSVNRLNVDRLDFVWVHDVAQDFHGDGWLPSSKSPIPERFTRSASCGGSTCPNRNTQIPTVTLGEGKS
jgi:D-threo-aldose 1-dehydrogenase